MKKTHSMLFIPGIIMLGIVLRTPFTTLPTVLSDIAASLGVDVSSLGLLTSLPLLADKTETVWQVLCPSNFVMNSSRLDLNLNIG